MSLLGRLIGRPDPERNTGARRELPSGGQRPLTMQEMVQRYIREEISKSAAADDMETFEESDDFGEDDPEIIPLTHHQVIAMDEVELRGVALQHYGIDLVDDMETASVADSGSSGGDKGSNPADPAKPPF